jgi:RHS repeat-associated protein
MRCNQITKLQYNAQQLLSLGAAGGGLLSKAYVPTLHNPQSDPMPFSVFRTLNSGVHQPNLFFYHPDHLGSTGMVTDNSSNITQGMLYAPFGEIISDYSPAFHDSPMPNYAFNAKELDEENGMYYYSARYYAPPTFISRDPLFEKYPSISPYAYCANNPVMFVDPDGRTKIPWFDKKNDKTLYKGAMRSYDDGAIHIFAHGSSKHFTAIIEGQKVKIQDAETFNKILSEQSEKWKNRKEGDILTVILHSCNTGRGNSSIAQKLSIAFKNVKFIAPTERDYFSRWGEKGTYKAQYADTDGSYKTDENGKVISKERSDELGSWRVFLDGKETGKYKGNWTPKENPTKADEVLYKE